MSNISQMWTKILLKLENELLCAKPEIRRNPPRNVKKAKSATGKATGAKLPDNFLRVSRITDKSNISTSSDITITEDNFLDAMGSTVSDIKEDLNGVNSKLNRMLSLMRVFSNKIKKLESKVEEQDKIITNHKREIQRFTNRYDNNER